MSKKYDGREWILREYGEYIYCETVSDHPMALDREVIRFEHEDCIVDVVEDGTILCEVWKFGKGHHRSLDAYKRFLH